jgi:hypothetical protein
MTNPATTAATSTTRPMVHCILRDPPLSEALPAGLRWIGADGLRAVVRDLDPDEVRGADNTRLAAYADLIARIHRDETLIPMRFGCVFPTDAAVGKLLAGHRGRLLAMLEQLDGCVEYGVRLVLPIPPPESSAAPPSPPTSPNPGAAAPQDARPGHGHLAAIRRRLGGEAVAAARARAARDLLEAAVAGRYRDLREEFGQIGGHYLLSLYFLVPRPSGAGFLAALQRAQSATPGAGLVTGPWPPYNFVGAIDDDLRAFA